MTYLFYLDKITEGQRRTSALIAAGFLFFEALVIITTLDEPLIAFGLVAVGAYIFGRLQNQDRLSLSLSDLPPWPDLLLYVVIVSETFALSSLLGIPPLRIPPAQVFSGRLDIELFSIALFLMLIAILCPSFNDLRIYKKHLAGEIPEKDMFREPDYLKKIPPDWRRWSTAWTSLLLFGLVTVLMLSRTQNLWISTLIIFGFLLVAPSLFKYIYGYRSHIIGFFGRGLFFVVIVVCLLNSQFAPRILSWIPNDIIPHMNNLNSFMSGVLAVASLVLMNIWKPNSNRLLVSEQLVGHTLYFVVFWVGQAVIFWVWTHPSPCQTCS